MGANVSKMTASSNTTGLLVFIYVIIIMIKWLYALSFGNFLALLLSIRQIRIIIIGDSYVKR